MSQDERAIRPESLAERPTLGELDVLSQLLRAVRLTGESVDEFVVDGASVRREFADGGGVLHLVESGTLQVELAEPGQRWDLGSGDAMLMPMGAAHVVRSDAPGTRWLTGTFKHDVTVRSALVDGVPRGIVLTGVRDQGLEWFDVSRRLLLKERDQPSPGSAVMIGKILDLLFIQFLRVWAASSDAPAGWLRAAHDSVIGSVVDALHADPSRRWSVTEMARAARLSRSGFVDRFGSATGAPPMTYLTDLRMELARNLLLNTSGSVRQIASEVGYASDAAFTRVFTQRQGMSPTRWRRAGQA